MAVRYTGGPLAYREGLITGRGLFPTCQGKPKWGKAAWLSYLPRKKTAEAPIAMDHHAATLAAQVGPKGPRLLKVGLLGRVLETRSHLIKKTPSGPLPTKTEEDKGKGLILVLEGRRLYLYPMFLRS